MREACIITKLAGIAVVHSACIDEFTHAKWLINNMCRGWRCTNSATASSAVSCTSR